MFLKSGRVSYGGVITAVMVVLLYLSCVFENCSLFCLAAAAFLGGVTSWQRGRTDGILVSVAAGVLGVLLIPNKWYILTYAAFVVYVLVWEWMDQGIWHKHKVAAWVLKGVLYHALLFGAVWSYAYMFGLDQLVQGTLQKLLEHSKMAFGFVVLLFIEIVWIVFDRAYAVFRQKWALWLHRAGMDPQSRL